VTLIDTARAHSAQVWSDEIVPALHDYIRIPNVSAAFDPEWAAHGHMAEAVELVRAWCAARDIAGSTVEVLELPGRTPLLLVDVVAFGQHGSDDDTVLLYGHLDKQPEMSGWRDDLGPWLPVVEGDRLYGRGGADDGYAAFASLTAIEAVQRGGGSHHRCIVLIEASEESGSPDLPAHLEALGDRIGTPSLVVCLDSGCLDYERLWVTTSLRGLAGGTLSVEILGEGVHSGEASGVVPSSFRIARQLLDRVEDAANGDVLVPELHVEIPEDRVRQASATAAEFSEPISSHFPFVPGAGPMVDDPVEQILNRTWRPTLSVIGAEGLPPAANAGNVLRPRTALKLSFRLPPTCDPQRATAAVSASLLADPPYGAHVTFAEIESGPGWNAPSMAPWLEAALDDASTAVFGRPARAFGEGGSIPFMGMLGAQFPDAQFVVTGVMGPGTNAHGPNEYLHLPTGERVTAALALVLDAHARHDG
jgi:acetylornithine deacetylase/succinyl-diaminopimelate desuccinylase-like protein